jgi:hypothetical protein
VFFTGLPSVVVICPLIELFGVNTNDAAPQARKCGISIVAGVWVFTSGSRVDAVTV